MDTFQYETREVSKSTFERGSVEELKYLTDKGKAAWELTSVVSNAPTMNYDSTVYYFKRKILKY